MATNLKNLSTIEGNLPSAADMKFGIVVAQWNAQVTMALKDGAVRTLLNAGFLQVIDKYGSTPEGNLAKHYAGICYLRMGDLQNALDYLKQYKASGEIPGTLVTAQNLGLQGDVLSQQGNYKEAVALYEKAVKASDNVLTAPYYLKKAGLTYEKLGDNAKALAAYKTIQTDYAVSMEARDIQKFIGRLEQFVRFEIAHTVAIVTVVGILADTKPVSSGLCRNCGFICGIV